ncbi:hypothetical protein FYJ43_09855 [Cutibacterium sp. WCA-380-WT-3A]|uniref:Uncharacterized protein n=1 Tax=Cutibacterium porci TaxID=2605781 RepID=A0A7K0J8N3_9ACTN|nr:hypothetical protein [Cutibacterium porci]MSS46316.1 hypothetical protein [Cutibacterium porci]
MTDTQKTPSRGEKVLAAVVAFTLWMALVFAIVAIFVGWRWSLRIYVGVLLIGIPGEIMTDLVSRNQLWPHRTPRIGRSRGWPVLVSALILIGWAFIVLAATALIQPWYGATGDMAWVMVVGIVAILAKEIFDARKRS